MGRIFEKRKDRMFARWAKNAKAFTKLGKEIAIAIKLGGADSANNPRLRMAVQTARSLNMPKDRIDAAIKRASGKDEAELQENVYPGYGPHGVALIIVTATDNSTRTVANVRSILTHSGGSLAASGALDFMFKHVGVFKIKTPASAIDELELTLIDFGLEEFEQDGEEITLQCSFSTFGSMQKVLEEQGVEVISAGAEWLPSSTVSLDEAKEVELKELIEELEEDDDVQHVFHNLG